MKPGDLVKIPKARIGVPADSIGLIIDSFLSSAGRWLIYEIQLCGGERTGNTVRRLAEDLEVISASR
jgi:hypothetical protein